VIPGGFETTLWVLIDTDGEPRFYLSKDEAVVNMGEDDLIYSTHATDWLEW
jgi:hypothetical protein